MIFLILPKFDLKLCSSYYANYQTPFYYEIVTRLLLLLLCVCVCVCGSWGGGGRTLLEFNSEGKENKQGQLNIEFQDPSIHNNSCNENDDFYMFIYFELLLHYCCHLCLPYNL